MSMIKRKLAKFAPFFQSAMVVLIASLFVFSIVYAATTIGTNITTEGTLGVTGAYASTTGYVVVGTGLGAQVPSAGDLFVSDGLTVINNATTSGWLNVGTTDVVSTLGALIAAGDLYTAGNATSSGNLSVGGFASTTGYLKVGGGVFDLATSTGATTTPGIFSRDETTSTSTVSVGDIFDGATKKQVGCLELAAADGAYYNCFIDVATPSLVCQAGRCN